MRFFNQKSQAFWKVLVKRIPQSLKSLGKIKIGGIPGFASTGGNTKVFGKAGCMIPIILLIVWTLNFNVRNYVDMWSDSHSPKSISFFINLFIPKM